jgi:hypothetical protein
MQKTLTLNFDALIESVARDLVSIQHVEQDAFIGLPLLYPSGSPVTIRIVRASDDNYQVSDNGFAYREIESVGAERSFPGTASQITDAYDLRRNSRAVFTYVGAGALLRAVCDVGASSWQIADRIYANISEDGEQDIEDYVRDRLTHIFGATHVESQSPKLVGASTSEWDVTAIVRREDRSIVFQAVAAHANSIYRTNSAFDDLAALERAPGLVAVVRNRAALGSRLSLLSRTGRIIEDQQPDDVYMRAAA